MRLPESLGLDASGKASKAAEWIRWYLKTKNKVTAIIGPLFWLVTCLPLQRLFVYLESPPGQLGCEHHRLPGLQFKAKNIKLRLQYKPMARAPDSPANLTRAEVGAISETEDPVRELLVWVEVDTGGKLDRSRQSGHAGLHSKRKWYWHTIGILYARIDNSMQNTIGHWTPVYGILYLRWMSYWLPMPSFPHCQTLKTDSAQLMRQAPVEVDDRALVPDYMQIALVALNDHCILAVHDFLKWRGHFHKRLWG